MNVHFMAVPADRMVTVDIPVAVYEIFHVTVVLLIARHDITEIHCFLLQRAMRIILSLHPVLQQNGADVFPLQKERGPLLGLFMMKYFKLDLYDIL